MAGTDLYPVAGAKMYIGGVLATKATDFAVADFSAQSWTLIDGWETMGAIGDAAQIITTSIINRGRDVKQKGTRNAGSMQNVFAILGSDPGQIALIAAEKTSSNYAFKIEFDDAPVVRSFTATIAQASPAVVTKVAHGLAANTPVVLSTTGTLPTGLSPATTYYVKTVLDADTFTLSATPGGTAINTSGAGSGTHTVTTAPTGSQRLFVGLVTSAQEAGGGANTVQKLNGTIEINSNIVPVAALG